MRYTVYNMDGFKLVAAGEIEADTDKEAVRIAREQGSGDHVEAWQGTRKVRVVAPAKPKNSLRGGTHAR